MKIDAFTGFASSDLNGSSIYWRNQFGNNWISAFKCLRYCKSRGKISESKVLHPKITLKWENSQKVSNRWKTYHIFPETQVYSVRTPNLDELPIVLVVQVWSHPVKLESIKEIKFNHRLLDYQPILQLQLQVDLSSQKCIKTWERYLRSGSFNIVYIRVAISMVNILPLTQKSINASLQAD